MMSSRTRNGGIKVAERGNTALSNDAVKLLKTQDAGYLRTVAAQTRKALERAEQARIIGDAESRSSNNRTIFVDDVEEQARYVPLVQNVGVEQSDTEDVENKERPALTPSAFKEARITRRRRKRDQAAQKLRVQALRTRERDLMAAERDLELQRAKMSNGIGGTTRAGVKFKIRERKK